VAWGLASCFWLCYTASRCWGKPDSPQAIFPACRQWHKGKRQNTRAPCPVEAASSSWYSQSAQRAFTSRFPRWLWGLHASTTYSASRVSPGPAPRGVRPFLLGLPGLTPPTVGSAILSRDFHRRLSGLPVPTVVGSTIFSRDFCSSAVSDFSDKTSAVLL